MALLIMARSPARLLDEWFPLRRFPSDTLTLLSDTTGALLFLRHAGYSSTEDHHEAQTEDQTSERGL